jgi:hypothetical protein
MNVDAWNNARETRKQLAASVRLGLAIASADDARSRFRALHSSWKQYTKGWVAWEDEPFAMGSIRTMLAALNRDQMWRHRREALDEWISRVRPENPPTP